MYERGALCVKGRLVLRGSLCRVNNNNNLFIINRRIAFVTKKVERLAISKCITPVRGSYNGISIVMISYPGG
jgi:hypothetical protein